MCNVLSGEFENIAKCEHRICLDKFSNGLSPTPYYKQKERTKRFHP